METYILQILEKNNRLIVPEFGAFIVKQRNPLTIVFNEFLQYNDGMLVDFISKTDGITKDQAKDKVDKFIEDVNREIKKNNAYSLGKLGILKKSPAGKISIEKSEGAAATPKKEAPKAEKKAPAKVPAKATKAEAADEKKAAAKPPETKKPAESASAEKKGPADTKASTPADDKKKTTTPPASQAAEKPREEKKDEKPAQTVKVTATTGTPVTDSTKTEAPKAEAPKAEASKPLSSSTDKQAVKTPETSDPKKETLQHAPYRPAETGKTDDARRKKRRRHIVLWVILIVIVNLILIGYFLFQDEVEDIWDEIVDKVEEVLNKDSSESEEAPEDTRTKDSLDVSGYSGAGTMMEGDQSEMDAYGEDNGTASENQSAGRSSAQVRTTQSSAQSSEAVASGRYWVIAGAFFNENYANNRVSELQAAGYDAQKKYNPKNGMFHVCYGAFDTFSEAQALLNQVKAKQPDAWVKKW